MPFRILFENQNSLKKLYLKSLVVVTLPTRVRLFGMQALSFFVHTLNVRISIVPYKISTRIQTQTNIQICLYKYQLIYIILRVCKMLNIVYYISGLCRENVFYHYINMGDIDFFLM